MELYSIISHLLFIIEGHLNGVQDAKKDLGTC